MIYGYCRCSTNEDRQDINRQVRELKKMGVSDEKYIYKEYISGTTKEKPELEKLKAIVTSGDTICATEPSRLTRSTKQLCDIIDFCKEKHLRLELGNFVVDCTKELDPLTEGMLKMMGVFSELERHINNRWGGFGTDYHMKPGELRMTYGQQALDYMDARWQKFAKAKGKKIGRAKSSINNIPKDVIKFYEFYKTNKINKTTYAKMCGCTRQSIYKYIKIIEGVN